MASEITVDSITLSEGRIVEQGTGKVTFINTFHFIRSHVKPVKISGMIINLALTNFPLGQTEAKFRVQIESREGDWLWRGNANLKVTMGAEPKPQENPTYLQSEMILDIPIRTTAIEFSDSGLYSVVVYCGDILVKRKNFVVDVMEEPTKTEPPKP